MLRFQLLIFLLLFCVATLMEGKTVCAQGFHHPPPPPPHHHPEPAAPPRPPTPPPTHFIPPPRPNQLRPPSEDQKMLHQWKTEVVDRVQDIANDYFGFNEETDRIEIDDPWDEQNWSEWDTGDNSFINHDYEVTRIRLHPPEKIEVGDWVYPDMPDYAFVQNIDAFSFPETFSLEGPVYTLGTLPEVALKKIDTQFINTDDPDLRFIIIYGNGQDGITIYTVNELAPGIYKRDPTDSPILTHVDPYHTTELNGEIVEISPEWKDVSVISLANCKLTKVDVQSTTINTTDYNAPEQLAPVMDVPQVVDEQNTPTEARPTTPESQKPLAQQPEPEIVQGQEQLREKISFAEPENSQPIEQSQPEIKMPTVMELTEMQSQQQLDTMLGQGNPQPTEYLSVDGYQPQETRRIRTEPNIPEGKPLTDSQLIDFSDDISFDKFQETVSDSGQLPERIAVQPNYIDLGNEEFGGDVIIHQFDQEAQKVMVNMAEDAVSTTSDAALLYVGVQFPLAGTVVSGVQGAVAGFDKAINEGKGAYETVWNMAVGGITNAGVGAVGGKIGELGKLKVTGKMGEKLIDYGGGYLTNVVGGAATEEMTSYDNSTYGTYGSDSGGLYINPGLNLVK